MLFLLANIIPMSSGFSGPNATADNPSQMHSVSDENVHGTFQGKTAMHNINGAGFYLTADFIYWEAREAGLDYATGVTKNETVYKEYGLGFQWEPGCKVGAGYTFSYDGWDLYANWTHLNSKASGSSKVTQFNDELIPFWTESVFLAGSGGAGVGITPRSHANSSWLLFYNTVDLELGRNYFNSKAISFRPFFGVRAAWIDQKVSSRSWGELTGEFASSYTIPEKFWSTYNYGGIGLRAGIDALYHFTSAWGLYAKAAASLLYGQVHIRSRSDVPSMAATSPVQFYVRKKIVSNYWTDRFNIEGALGITWETFFHDKHSHLALSLGYELTDWLDLNLINPDGGNLFLQGLTFSSRYDF